MDGFIHVVPAADKARSFAQWALTQNRFVYSYPGWDVPLSKYPHVPVSLLEGALVDGYTYGVPAPQPRSEEAEEVTVGEEEAAGTSGPDPVPADQAEWETTSQAAPAQVKSDGPKLTAERRAQPAKKAAPKKRAAARKS